MKTHLKALVVTIGLFLLIVGVYYFMTNSKGHEVIEGKLAKKSQIEFPKMEMKSLLGNVLRTQEFAGKAVIFNFWASWCSPCIEEVPSLVSLVKADPDIIIVAVSGDQSKDDIDAFLKSFPGFNKPPVYIVHENAKALMDHFSVDKLPESFIFNSKGEMVKKITGTINWHTPESLEYFKSLRAP